MKQAEYTGKVLEDGHLSLPESVRKQLGLQPSTLVQVSGHSTTRPVPGSRT